MLTVSLQNWAIFLTPKAYHSNKEPLDFLTDTLGLEVCATADVYMNMLGGWTEAECDDVIYFVDMEQFRKSASPWHSNLTKI
jgi:hypothetical protein